MWDISYGAVLLASPSPAVLDWCLTGVALALGCAVHLPHQKYYQALCVGACVWCIARDFSVPLDMALVACLPVSLARWTSTPWTQSALVAAVAVNYFLASPVDVPTNSWTPALAAFLFVARGSSKVPRVALVLARYLAPMKVHVLYGGPLYLLAPASWPVHDRETGAALAYSLCAMLAREVWYAEAAAAAGAALALVPYIRSGAP